MTHLSMDALLALREPGSEPGVAAAREHLNACVLCQAELDRLHQRVARLKALPALRPGRDHWPATGARFRAERARRRLRRGSLAALATAASIALAVTVADRSQPAPASIEVAAYPNQLSEAMERSQALESALSEYNPDGRLLDGRTARIAQELEDRIARLDRELEMTELAPAQARDNELLRLWRERVGLLDALVDVHVTRASNAGL
jgi:hypothetical protein